MKIAVLGGGNGSYAAAADLSDRGHEVRFWRRDADALRPVLENRTIRRRDFSGTRDIKIARPTTDIADAVRGAELIVAPIPAFAQADLAAHLAPHLTDGQVIFLPPGTFGSYLMTKVLRAAGCRAEIMIAETGTLPWLTRKHGAAEVAITTRATRLPTGVFPARLTDTAIAVIAAAFPDAIEPVEDALSGALDECGADHSSAAHSDECRPDRAFRPLGHSQGRHAALHPPGARSARPRAHRDPRSVGLRRAAFSAGGPLHHVELDVRQTRPRQACRFRRLARTSRSEEPSLHAGRCRHGIGLPGFGRRMGGNAVPGRGGPAWRSRRPQAARPSGVPAAPCMRSALPAKAATACAGCCKRVSDNEHARGRSSPVLAPAAWAAALRIASPMPAMPCVCSTASRAMPAGRRHSLPKRLAKSAAHSTWSPQFGGFDAQAIDAVMARISLFPHDEAEAALSGAGIVFEAVPETDDAKRCARWH